MFRIRTIAEVELLPASPRKRRCAAFFWEQSISAASEKSSSSEDVAVGKLGQKLTVFNVYRQAGSIIRRIFFCVESRTDGYSDVDGPASNLPSRPL